MRVLLTNDDGIQADGLQAFRRALLDTVEGIDLQVVAPDGDRSAIGRGITIRRPLRVREFTFDDGGTGYMTDGTPVDCVRLATLGLVDGWTPELIVSGINHGSNVGDDISYSGTVAAAIEGLLLGLPAVAVSQQAPDGYWHGTGGTMDFTGTAAFAAKLVDRIDDVRLESGTLINVNAPKGDVSGVEVTRLGRRYYRDELNLLETDDDGASVYRIYGPAPEDETEEGTDVVAVAQGRIAVTPLHFDLTDGTGVETLSRADLASLLGPAAQEVE
jgi:5'-nucleotidase